MDNDQIVSRMNTYLHTSANVLAEWLGKLLPRTSDDWWEDCVMAKLSYNQAEMARERGFTELGQFDLAALLRIVDKSWYEMRNVAFLPTRERECVRDMMRVRNNWAHVSAMLPGKDAIIADLTTLHDFFEQRECEDSLVNEVDRMIEEVKSPSTVDFASFSQEEQVEQTPEEPEAIDENEITEKSLVYLVGNPDVRGIVMSITDLGDTKKYDVFVDGNFKTFYSGQIALYVETASYNWVDINTFRSYLTAYQINNPWLTQKSLQILIEQYLFRRLGQGSYILGESEMKQLRLSAAARAELRDDFRKLPSGRNAVRQSWDVYLKGKAPIHPITFDSETAEKKRDTFFITAMHPLAKQAAAYFASNEQAYIRLQYATEDLPAGSYHFSVYAWSYVGINPHFKLVVVCDDDVIAAELPDILQESQSGAAAVKMQPSDWDAMEKKQVKLWMDEKAAEIKEAENTSTFKIESLSNNFRNRKRSLEQKILDTSSESIRRMYTSELESATESYELKVEEIRKDLHCLRLYRYAQIH